MSGANDKILKLEIQSDEGTSTFALAPGKAVVIGRTPQAELKIKRASVSHEHLKILWTGNDVRIMDLGSSYGTFRLPQDSPFKEASFPPVYPAIELRLAKMKLRISWSTNDFRAEATEVVAVTELKLQEPEVGSSDKIPKSTKQEIPLAADPAAKSRSHELQIDRRSVPRVPSPSVVPAKTVSPERTRAAFFLVACACFFLALSLGLGAASLRGLLLLPAAQLKGGAIWDALAIWTHALAVNRGALILLLVMMSGGAGLVWAKPERTWLKRWSAPRVGSGWLAGLAALIVVFAFGWPYAWSLRYGARPALWGQTASLYAVAGTHPSEQLGVEDLKREELSLKKFKTNYAGSSLLYRSLFDHERLRVLKECAGLGDAAPWESKKVCLVLLFSSAVEAREETHPAALADLSARAALLLSLDGIVRVLSTEGIAAPVIPFFLESLNIVGLKRDREDLERVLATVKDPDTQKQAILTLQDLRKQIEIEFIGRQKRQNLPAAFDIYVPGPLESGI